VEYVDALVDELDMPNSSKITGLFVDLMVVAWSVIHWVPHGTVLVSPQPCYRDGLEITI
jgi:hypothetical protein